MKLPTRNQMAPNSMAWKKLSAAVILAIGLSQPAFAELIVLVEAFVDGGPDADDEKSFAPPTKIVSGVALANADGASAEVKAGGFSCGEPGQIPCSMSGPAGGSGFTRGQANGLAGSLRGFAQASSDALTGPKGAGAIMTLRDTISFTGAAPVVNFDIDLSSSLTGDGSSSLRFTFVLENNEVAECEEEQCPPANTLVAELVVDESRNTGDNLNRHFYRLTFDDGRPPATGAILNSYQFTYDLGEHQAPGATSFDILAELTVSADAGTDFFDPIEGGFAPFESFARMAADQSVFIQIDNVTSANGYNYPGRPGTQPNQVPAPASLALLAIGLAGLGVARRRKRWEPAR